MRKYITIRRAAFNYRKAGLSVLPIGIDGDKAPYTALLPARGWKCFRDRRPTKSEMNEMFSGDVPVGVAILGGSVSGGLEIIDIDDGSTWTKYRAMVNERAPGLLDRIPQVVSPRESGGRHLYIWSDHAGGCGKLARDEDGGTLIEVKGEGGYCLVPGSHKRCHQTRREYRHSAGPPITDKPRVTMEERTILFACATALDRYVPEEPATYVARSATAGQDSPGNIYMARETFESSRLLEKHGWTKLGNYGDRIAWARPGKTDPGFSALSGPDRHGHDRLVVFSSNAKPFASSTVVSDSNGASQAKPGASYNLFQAYALLEHKGDFSRAALQLAREGYTSDEERDHPREDLPNQFRPWISFPVDLLPAPCAEYIRASAKAIDCDPALVAVPLLGSLAGGVGFRRIQRFRGRRDWKQPCILWTATIAPTGSAKTPAWNAACKYLLHMDAAEADKFRNAMAEYEIQLEQYRNDRRGNRDAVRPERPVRHYYRVQDVTIEKLVAVFEQQPEGAVLLWNELSGWVGTFDRYRSSGSDEQKYLECWDGGSFSDGRIGEDRDAPHAALSIVGNIQPTVFRRVMHHARYENGLVQRFLLTKPPVREAKFQSAGVGARLDRKMASLFKKLTELEMEDGRPVEVFVSEEATEIYRTWQHDSRSHLAQLDEEDPLRGFYSKLDLIVVRFALLFHLVEQVTGEHCHDEIQCDCMARAIDLAEWFRHEVSRIYMLMLTDDREDSPDPLLIAMAEHLEKQQEWVSVRDVQRGPRRFRNQTADEVEELLRQLVEMGWAELRQKKSKKGGRAVSQFRLKECRDRRHNAAFSAENRECHHVAMTIQNAQGAINPENTVRTSRQLNEQQSQVVTELRI